MGNDVFLGLGSNLGDRENFLTFAVKEISRDPDCELKGCSSVYRTKPFGITDQPEFLNAVIQIATDLSPVELFNKIKSIENSAGKRANRKWGPRHLDIDILLYGKTVYSDGNITIPHKNMLERDFVLVPLLEIDPETEHPLKKNKLKNFLTKLSENFILERTNINLLNIPGVKIV